MSKRLLIALLVSLLPGCSEESGGGAPAAVATQWQRVDLTFDQPIQDPNPFDAEGETVQVEILRPDGASHRIDAFASRDYERALIGGYEHVTAVSELRWQARFTPTAPGEWQWRWIARRDGVEQPGEWNRIEVAPPAAEDHGFVRISPRDPRYLELDDGTSYFPIGENMCWYDGPGTFAYEEWITRLAAEGGNYIRLWMASWGFALEWISRDGTGAVTSNTLGNYDARLDRAWQLDYVLDLAARHGIRVMLAIQYHGAFSLTSNVEWENNPYNAANGGPLARPREFFTNDEAKQLFKQRLRYIVARWGYATHLLSWELWNEVDLAEQPSLDELTAWHSEMAAELDALDPYDHLISTSASQADALNPNSAFGALWALPEIDFSQVHFYAFGGAAADFTQAFPRTVNRLRRYQKPIFVAEAGVDFRGSAETIESDPHGDGFHDLLWAAPFAGAFGSGMTWWWDNVIDPLDLYSHFGPLAELMAGIDVPGEAFVVRSTTVAAPDGRNLKVFTLFGRSTTLVWIKNARHLWHSPDLEPIVAASVFLEGINSGPYRGFWLDTRDGSRTEIALEGGAEGGALLEIPTFSRDIALRIERESPS